MNLVEHLEHVLRLVEKSAPHSEIKGALLAMHEEVHGAQQAAADQVTLNKKHADEVSALQQQTATLQHKNQELVTRYEHPDGDMCPFCQCKTGHLKRITPHPELGPSGLKVGYYKCRNCGKDYDKAIA